MYVYCILYKVYIYICMLSLISRTLKIKLIVLLHKITKLILYFYRNKGNILLEHNIKSIEKNKIIEFDKLDFFYSKRKRSLFETNEYI